MSSSRRRSFSAMPSRQIPTKRHSRADVSLLEITTSYEQIKTKNPRSASVENALTLTSIPVMVEGSSYLSYSEAKKNFKDSSDHLSHGIPVKHSKGQKKYKLPLSVLLAFSATSVGRGSITITLATYASSFYTDSIGISFGVMGIVVCLVLLLYALPQPFLGMIQDAGGNTQNHRKVWLLASGLCTSIVYFAFLCPPAISRKFATVWALFFASLLGPFWGCLDASHDSLGAQLTFDYEERTRLQGCNSIALSLGLILTSIAYGSLGTVLNVDHSLHENRIRMVLICSMGVLFLHLGLMATYLHPGMSAPQLITSRAKSMDFSSSIETFALVSPSEELSQKETVISVFKTSKNFPQFSQIPLSSSLIADFPLTHGREIFKTALGNSTDVSLAHRIWKLKFYNNSIRLILREVRSVFLNRPALIIMVSMSMGMISALCGALILQYFVKFVVQSNFLANWISLLLSISTLIFSFVWIYSVDHIKYLQSKGQSFVFSLGIIGLAQFITAIFSKKGSVSFFLIFTLMGQGLGAGGSLISAVAMKPDVIDYEEFRTGIRKEGLFMGVFLLCSKFSAAFVTGAMFCILQIGGFKAGADADDQPLLLLRIIFGGTTIICAGILALLMNAYPINSSVHELIITRTQIRHAGGWAVDPIYGGVPLPPYSQMLVVLSE
ncbi:transporter, major facilitator family protein [Cardiosporidium cionae]|uniref:Transporter, major facilitator family protein n=1 Tax=Cardiosporidium cionae TaxID=476202 RepID=A0ABQ7JAU1_9APIC|nr:transporter, major facilitator family protein [Cardiosporidium cionae]|eukprot:KAF8821123.1 transporter, major facilitator family protein [Cardiosporidium cionae]